MQMVDLASESLRQYRRRCSSLAPACCAADLLEGHGDAGDAVVVRSALQRREDGEVDLVLEVVHDLLALLVF